MVSNSSTFVCVYLRSGCILLSHINLKVFVIERYGATKIPNLLGDDSFVLSSCYSSTYGFIGQLPSLRRLETDGLNGVELFQCWFYSPSFLTVSYVSWDEDGEDYTERRLRAFFSRFGEVEEMLFKNRGPAEIVMATKDAAVKGFQHDCAVHEKFEGKKQQ
ncbi:hypothetical protein DVH24_041597 [Malus domestica]|uniref:RRM domain-containing protein n=1 Tax=Malus domestica TaxID=3750 RepID=A0A498INU7_MALDO|nr:hypothetical protein DVH24_041597 [Malus domestica]